MKPLFQLLQRPLLFVAVFSFFVNLLLLAPALFMLQVFDRVLTSQSHETLLVLLLGMAVALGLMLVLDYLRSRLQGVAGNLIAEQLSPTVAKVMLAKSARRAERVPSEGLRDVAALRNLFSAQGLLALFDTPWAFVYVAVIWLAHPVLGMAAAAASLLMLILAVVNDRITRRDIEALQKEAAKATRYLESSMQNAEVVQSLGMGNALVGRWRDLNAKVTSLQGPTARKSVAMAAFTRTTRQSVQVLMQALGAYLVISGEGTPGILVATTILLGRALSPVEQVVGSWRVLAEGRLAFARLSELLGAAERQPERMTLPAPTGRLHAQGLMYRPPHSERMILAGVSLTLEPGESLAIIGPSGAGKSTLVRLLTGLWQPNAGVVRLDHVDLAQWPREELGPWLGYVPQDVELFPGTVADNIARLGEVDSAMVVRALYGDPKLLVLDEPNSNLDGAGELALGEALKALNGQVTVVVVTHRSTLVQHMDKMLVLEAGRVQQYGTVADVMQAMKQPGQNPGSGQVVVMRRGAGASPHADSHHAPAAAEEKVS